MRYWRVTFEHVSLIEAETEAEACEQLAQSVRDNAEAGECSADEIDQAEYEAEWDRVLEADEHDAG
jgi:hypothetical protein